ncbi:hypothetical protein FAGKG844_420034 [Frankia sp. AgKG'84/4]
MLLGVAAELLAHRGEDLVREQAFPAGAEPLVERRRQHMGGHALLDRGQHRPAALTGVGDPAAELRQLGVGVQGGGGEVQQPGGDHAATAPDLGDRGGVEVVLVVLRVAERGRLRVVLGRLAADVRLLQDGEALGESGHHAVLDAVVDHLHEVPGTVRPAVQVALFRLGRLAGAAGRALDRAHAGRDRLEQRLEAGDGRRLAADHQAEAALQTEHAAGGADVHVVHALGGQRTGLVDVVPVVRVATVDDDVVRCEVLGERCHGLAGQAGGNHDPGGPWRAQGRGELGERARPCGALRLQGLDGLGVHVVDHALMATADQPAHQVRAHSAESDHPELHLVSPLVSFGGPGGRVCRGRAVLRLLPPLFPAGGPPPGRGRRAVRSGQVLLVTVVRLPR